MAVLLFRSMGLDFPTPYATRKTLDVALLFRFHNIQQLNLSLKDILTFGEVIRIRRIEQAMDVANV